MKGRDIERLARKHLLPVLAGFAARGGLVYRRPVHCFLHGLSFDTSSFTSTRIFVQAFVKPLFGPDDYLTYTYGFRLGTDFWDVDHDPDTTFAQIAETARRDALPFFDSVTDVDSFCALVPKWANERPLRVMRDNTLDDPAVMEDLAYAEILRGHKDQAVTLLEDALRSERDDGAYASDDRIGNLEHMLDIVQRRGLEAGQAQLEEWRTRTIDRLKLEA